MPGSNRGLELIFVPCIIISGPLSDRASILDRVVLRRQQRIAGGEIDAFLQSVRASLVLGSHDALPWAKWRWLRCFVRLASHSFRRSRAAQDAATQHHEWRRSGCVR